ncbi:MAG TPA: translation elongation factor Ts [Actinomycetota bacterium]
MTDHEITAGLVKQLRDATGAGMMDCKRALVEAGGDMPRAQEILRTKGLASAKKRTGRKAREGLVDAYIHGGGRIGAMVEVNTETDFVARTDEFRTLVREIAMQVAARDPRWVSREDVPDDVLESERKIAAEKARADGKPEQVIDRIVDGQLAGFYKEYVLLEQDYIREPKRTVGDLVSEVAAKVGENVIVRRFARYLLGEEA